MYFLQKEGVYGQGIFWIGQSVAQGITIADKAAAADTDDYHRWVVFKYNRAASKENYAETGNKHHEVMYCTKKQVPSPPEGAIK